MSADAIRKELYAVSSTAGHRTLTFANRRFRYGPNGDFPVPDAATARLAAKDLAEHAREAAASLLRAAAVLEQIAGRDDG